MPFMNSATSARIHSDGGDLMRYWAVNTYVAIPTATSLLTANPRST